MELMGSDARKATPLARMLKAILGGSCCGGLLPQVIAIMAVSIAAIELIPVCLENDGARPRPAIDSEASASPTH